MSTPSSRLVLVTTAFELARLERRLDLASTVGVERRVVGGDGLGPDVQRPCGGRG